MRLTKSLNWLIAILFCLTSVSITAAAAGLSTAVLAISAAIYAQAKGLWKYVPTWLRVIAWAFIAYGIAMTIWNLIDQLD